MNKPLSFLHLITPTLARIFIVPSFVIILLSSCQFQEEPRILQVESPQGEGAPTKTPPSHKLPLVTAVPGNKPVDNTVDMPDVTTNNHSSAPMFSKTSKPAPVPTPDLPSLAHLINRKLEAKTTETKKQRPLVPPPKDIDTVRAAILLPLSGRNAALGQAMLNAAKLAIFDFADRRLELLPVDTKGTPKGAQEAAAAAIGDYAQIILGPLLSTSVRAVAPSARAAGVPVIAFSSDRSVAGSGVYTMGFVPADQVRRVVKYAFQKSLTRFAILAPDNTYGSTVVKALKRTIEIIGAKLVDSKFYNPRSDDFADVVRGLARYDSRRKALLKQRASLEAKNDSLSKSTLRRLEPLHLMRTL